MSTNLKSFQDFNPDDWLSQAEAARKRGVSRQAINKLIKNGRLKSIEIGGIKLVNKREVEEFIPMEVGRKKNINR